MKIELDIDSEGKPRIVLDAYSDDSIEGKTLERFIELAHKKGIKIEKSCSVDESYYQHADIKII